MLCKHLVDLESLCMIYYGFFLSIMYGSQIWGQQIKIVKKLHILQNKALRIINFYPPVTPLQKI